MNLQSTSNNAILYTDGGFMPNTHEAGWGVHGYTFVHEDPKRGTGNPKVIPTDQGYLFEESGGTKVTVVQYFDMAGAHIQCGCNNEAEMIAFIKALELLKQNPHIENVKLFSDSRFVIQGTLSHLDKWISRGWIKANGEPVKYRPRWELVKQLMDELRERMQSLELFHIAGHTGHPGNSRAHSMASRGLVLAKKRSEEEFVSIREAQGYWNVKVEIPRILQSPRWYFSTSDENYMRQDGSAVYCVGTHGTQQKEEEFAGKPYADNFLGVVRMATPEPIMEELREFAMQRDKNRHGSVVLGILDNIFSPKTFAELTEYKTKFMHGSRRRIELLDSAGSVLLTEVRPVGKAFRMVDVWTNLTNILDAVKCGSADYTLTDITDLIYEAPDAKKGIRKIKASLTQVVKYLDVEVGFDLSKRKEESKPFTAKVRLILGSDILSRNQLSAVAEDVVSVHVVSWRESDNVGRYATLIELKSGDVGLWARYEANLFYNKSSR